MWWSFSPQNADYLKGVALYSGSRYSSHPVSAENRRGAAMMM